jgi:hypothetical protein
VQHRQDGPIRIVNRPAIAGKRAVPVKRAVHQVASGTVINRPGESGRIARESAAGRGQRSLIRNRPAGDARIASVVYKRAVVQRQVGPIEYRASPGSIGGIAIGKHQGIEHHVGPAADAHDPRRVIPVEPDPIGQRRAVYR